MTHSKYFSAAFGSQMNRFTSLRPTDFSQGQSFYTGRPRRHPLWFGRISFCPSSPSGFQYSRDYGGCGGGETLILVEG